MDASPSPRWRTPAAIAAVTALVIAAIWAFSVGRHRGTTPGATAGTTSASPPAPNPSASAGPPRLLHLQPNGNRAAAMAAPAAGTAAGSQIGGPNGMYVFEGAYPDGPAKGHVLTIAPATQEQVDALAHALGLPGGKKTADGWTATDGKHQLTVTTAGGNQWWYGAYAPPCAVASAGPAPDTASADSAAKDGIVCGYATASSGVAIAAPACVAPTGKEWVAPCNDTPDTYTPPPVAKDDAVRRAAAAVLAGAGVPLEGARVSVDSGTISVDPLIKGLPSVGLQTSVSVDVDGTVQYANGTLGALEDGDEYPLITAQQAFEQLQKQPRMMPMMMCINPSAKPMEPVGPKVDTPRGGPAVDVRPCGSYSAAPIPVVGATFGWSLQWLDDNSTVVVPSWLFTMKGDEQWPTPIVAVDPSFLPTPQPEPGMGTVEPGQVDPGAPAVSGGPAPAESAPSAVTGSATAAWTCQGSDAKFTAPVPCPTQPAAR